MSVFVRFRVPLLALSTLLLQACLGENGSGPSGASGEEVRLRVATTLPRTQSLAKGNLITLSRLVITLTSNATPADTVRDTLTAFTTPSLSAVSTADQTLAKTYTLKGLRTWSVSARVYDARDSLIHEGAAASAAFLKVGDSASVNLNLAPRFAMYEARFLNLPDSIGSMTGPDKQALVIHRLVLRVNGADVRDSTATPRFAALGTHALAYDYVRLGLAAETSTPPLGGADLYAVDFPNGSDTGFIVGGPANYRTTDGGLSWHANIDGVDHPAREFKYVSYFNGSQGLMSGDSAWLVVQNGGGIQPANRQSALVANNSSGPVSMASADTGYSMINSTSVTGSTTIRRTFDGGASWATAASQAGNFYGLFCLKPRECWAVGYQGQIRKNTGVASFGSLQRAGNGAQPNLRDVHFVNSSLGWAVGDQGVILATTDGGTNWNPQASGTTQKLNSVHFIDANNGFAVGENGTLLTTVDGGAAWTSRNSGTSDPLRGISFSGTRGYIVGANNTVLRIGGVQTVELLIYGSTANWNPANPLFRGMRYVVPVPGQSDSVSMSLAWMGPNTGVEKVQVTIGKIGKTTIEGTPIGGIPKRSRN